MRLGLDLWRGLGRALSLPLSLVVGVGLGLNVGVGLDWRPELWLDLGLTIRFFVGLILAL